MVPLQYSINFNSQNSYDVDLIFKKMGFPDIPNDTNEFKKI